MQTWIIFTQKLNRFPTKLLNVFFFPGKQNKP